MGGMDELADIVYATTLNEDKLEEYENTITSMMNDGVEGVFLGDVADKLDVSQTLLRGIIRRSAVLVIKGFKIEKVSDA